MNRLKFNKEVLKEIFSTVKKHMTLKELSVRIDTSYRTLKRWKSGESKIPEYPFNKISTIFPELIKFEREAKKVPFYWEQKLSINKFIKSLSKKELARRMKHARSFRKFKMITLTIKKNGRIKHLKIKTFQIRYTPINVDITNDDALEFYGILMGDGFISRFLNEGRLRKVIGISGNSKKDVQYFQNYVIPLIDKLFDIKPKLKFRKNENVVEIQIANRGLFDWLNRNGFPIGKKGQISIPKRITKLPIKKINNLIRGFFDTDGFITARKDEGYRYPYIIMTTISNPLRRQLKDILRKQNFPAYFHKENVVVRGIANYRRWFELIGSSNPRNLNRYKEWLNTGKIESVGKGQ